MVGMNAGTAVAGRKFSVLARMRRAGTGGTRAALLTLGAAMALAGGRAADADGTVAYWGRNEEGQCNPPAGLGSVMQIAGGGYHTIALKSDGTVACWGYNGYGQCNPPVGLPSVTQIAGGELHTIALKSDGTVACWGYNNFSQCNTPAGLASVTQIAGGYGHTIALIRVAATNQRTGVTYLQLPAAIIAALPGDTLLVSPWALTTDNVDYRGKSIELRSTAAVARASTSTTLFADGARLSAPSTIALDGLVNVPTNSGITISTDSSLAFAGDTFISHGASILAQNDGSDVALTGSMVLASDAVFNALAPIALTGSLDLLDGVLIAQSMTASATSNLISVGGTIDVDTLKLNGAATCLDSTIVAEVTTNAGSQFAASGDLVGALDNSGRVIATDNLVVVGDIHNQVGGSILAQVGVLYITGDLVNEGLVYGNVITAPGYGSGGTGGTQAGDGIRVAGSVSVGAQGELRFVEELWKFSVCGDMTIACAPGGVRFNGAELSFDGCAGATQKLEATSRDLGCSADALSGEDADVSLFGELSIASGSTVELIDESNNALGKGSEAIYAKGLHVSRGATLITNGIMVYAETANIEGNVDDLNNICELPQVPDADINDDGLVNGIDLAYVLTYWGSGTAIADLDRNGIVGASDLTIVLNGWTG